MKEKTGNKNKTKSYKNKTQAKDESWQDLSKSPTFHYQSVLPREQRAVVNSVTNTAGFSSKIKTKPLHSSPAAWWLILPYEGKYSTCAGGKAGGHYHAD